MIIKLDILIAPLNQFWIWVWFLHSKLQLFQSSCHSSFSQCKSNQVLLKQIFLPFCHLHFHSLAIINYFHALIYIKLVSISKFHSHVKVYRWLTHIISIINEGRDDMRSATYDDTNCIYHIFHFNEAITIK